jgi:hypothetical protein
MVRIQKVPHCANKPISTGQTLISPYLRCNYTPVRGSRQVSSMGGEPMLVEGQRRLVAEGLVGPQGVSDGLPGSQLVPPLLEGRRRVQGLIELLPMGPLGPLDAAVEPGGAGWQHEAADAPLLTGSLELGFALRPPRPPEWPAPGRVSAPGGPPGSGRRPGRWPGARRRACLSDRPRHGR